MSLILRSNSRFKGTQNLSTIADISQTAQEFYNEYAAAVTGDGGEIINPTATLAAITWAKNNGVALGGAHAVSASWGIKKTSEGQITKVYGLNGDVFTWGGQVGSLDVTTKAYPIIKFAATGDGNTISRLMQSTPKRNINSKSFVIGMAGQKPTGAGASLPAGIVKGVRANSFDLAVDIQLAGGPSRGPSTWTQNNAAIDFVSGTGNVAGGIAAYFNPSRGELVLTDNGVMVRALEVLPSPLIDASLAETSEIWIGGIQHNSSNINGSVGAWFTEFWLINDAELSIASALSKRFIDLYP